MILTGKSSLALVAAVSVYTSTLLSPPQFDTVADIPQDYFDNQNTIYGQVTRVIDGDTLRVAHCPTIMTCPSFDTKFSTTNTLSIRLYGVDSPELQKKKSDPPSQPFALEAKELSSNLALGRKVSLKLLKKDQYGRAIANVNSNSQDLSVQLVERGFAVVYRGKGAEYDGNKDLLLLKEKQAQTVKRGVWSIDGFISPAEFKRQQKLAMQQQQTQMQ